MLTVFKILRVHDMNLKLRVAANTHLSHELAFSLHGLLKLEFNLLLLPVMIHDVPHHLVLPFLQFVLRLNVLYYELFNGNGAVFIDINLVENLVHNLVAHLVVEDLLRKTNNTK